MVPRAVGSRGELAPTWLSLFSASDQAPWLLQKFSWGTGLPHTAASLVNSSRASSKGPQSNIWEGSKAGSHPQLCDLESVTLL